MFTPLPGYPTKHRNKNFETIDWVGPEYYLPGGIEFPASNFGWGGFDSGYGQISQSGDYRVEVQFSNYGAVQTVLLVVFVVATGLEVAGSTDLSDEVFRLSLMGV